MQHIGSLISTLSCGRSIHTAESAGAPLQAADAERDTALWCAPGHGAHQVVQADANLLPLPSKLRAHASASRSTGAMTMPHRVSSGRTTTGQAKALGGAGAAAAAGARPLHQAPIPGHAEVDGPWQASQALAALSKLLPVFVHVEQTWQSSEAHLSPAVWQLLQMAITGSGRELVVRGTVQGSAQPCACELCAAQVLRLASRQAGGSSALAQLHTLPPACPALHRLASSLRCVACRRT